MVKIAKIALFDIKSAINKKYKQIWKFLVISRKKLNKIQFFTKNCDNWSTFRNFILDFRLKLRGFCPPNSTLGSKILWRLLGDSWPLQVLLRYYTGVWEWVGGLKIGQKLKKLLFFDIKSAINQKYKQIWKFLVISRQELNKIQFFTKNWDNWSTFRNFILDFRLKFRGFCPPNSTFWHLNDIFTLLKSKILAFSGSKNLWRLLGDSWPLQVLLWYYTGVWE